jgi:predicted DNA-binding antitoxin AbrB/MazE fold protein
VTQTIEAIYANGVLKPTADLRLREQQRVRLILEPIQDDRQAALARLRAGIASMHFFFKEALPTREELHDRD